MHRTGSGSLAISRGYHGKLQPREGQVGGEIDAVGEGQGEHKEKVAAWEKDQIERKERLAQWEKGRAEVEAAAAALAKNVHRPRIASCRQVRKPIRWAKKRRKMKMHQQNPVMNHPHLILLPPTQSRPIW